jgi:uncharacterized protein (TIGR03000 family)
MRRALSLLACCLLLTAPIRADEIVFPDGTTSNQPGGLMIIRQGNQTTWSLGGAFLPRYVKVKTLTPEGPIVTKFKLPSVFHGPLTPPLPQAAPASLRVEIPDEFGLLLIDGEQVRARGTVRQLESPPLHPGKDFPTRVRAVFALGGQLLIEDREVVLRGGEIAAVTFDGSRAIAVPLRREP